jgi:hypothetical protein
MYVKTEIAFGRSRRIAPLRHRLKSLTEALIDQWADNPETQFYIRHQWAEWVRAAHLIKLRYQRRFNFARWLTVVGATTVPTLVGVGAQTHGPVATATQTSAVILSLMVAAAFARVSSNGTLRNRHNIHHGHLVSPSSRKQHFKASRRGRLSSRRHAHHRRNSHNQIRHPIRHFHGRRP